MQTELEQSDIQAIATAVMQMITPVLTGNPTDLRKEVMDVQEVAAYLRVESSWVYKQVQYKAIPHTKVGKYLRFRLKEVDRWLADQSVPAVSAAYPLMATARIGAARRHEGGRRTS